MKSLTTRAWGFWTQTKLQMLSEYLSGFATASKGQSERVYLDAFAGQAKGRDRLTGEEFPGSAQIALNAGDQAGFTRFRYFELASRADALRDRLRADYPDRDIEVYPGDCNETIPQALSDLSDLKWAPTFAFLDPDGMELAWTTLEALANHKRGYRSRSSPKPEFKVEQWMLFPSAGFLRTLTLETGKPTANDRERATRLFGTEQWQSIYELRRSGEIAPAEAREEYVNLMRWRLERTLLYRTTHPFEVKATKGPLYHMIFATDHDAGTRIMESIYAKAAKKMPEMQKEARDRASGQLALEIGQVSAGEGYRYEAPWEPRP